MNDKANAAAAGDDAAAIARALTVILTTSPTPSAPAPELVAAVLASFRAHCPALLACRIVVVLDGHDRVVGGGVGDDDGEDGGGGVTGGGKGGGGKGGGGRRRARPKRGLVDPAVAEAADLYRENVRRLVLREWRYYGGGDGGDGGDRQQRRRAEGEDGELLEAVLVRGTGRAEYGSPGGPPGGRLGGCPGNGGGGGGGAARADAGDNSHGDGDGDGDGDDANSVPFTTARTPDDDGGGGGGRITFVEPARRLGFGLAVREALRLTRTRYVWVQQHDWPLVADVPLRALLRVMDGSRFSSSPSLSSSSSSSSPCCCSCCSSGSFSSASRDSSSASAAADHQHQKQPQQQQEQQRGKDGDGDERVPVRYICLPSVRMLSYAVSAHVVQFPALRALTARLKRTFIVPASSPPTTSSSSSSSSDAAPASLSALRSTSGPDSKQQQPRQEEEEGAEGQVQGGQDRERDGRQQQQQRRDVVEVPLTPLFFWHDKPHVASTAHYLERVFPTRLAMPRGAFIEDTVGHRARRQMKEEQQREGAGWARWACWLYYPDDGRRLCLRHLHGRTWRGAEAEARKKALWLRAAGLARATGEEEEEKREEEEEEEEKGGRGEKVEEGEGEEKGDEGVGEGVGEVVSRPPG
ncbi:hypothetical protein GGR56DRAFT_693690 [Xylariaceae sp. FL0804]|nr:hypothetical protein GGR56DRAFT_693690 [Xylariaceae sp. FL0804]